MTLSNPAPLCEIDPGSAALAAEAGDVSARRSTPWYLRLPIISHLRSSVGLQRGMLITGVTLVAILLLSALLAPLISPYGFADTAADGTRFGAHQPPSAAHPLGTTVTGFDVLSRVIHGTRTAVAVMACAVAASLFLGAALGLPVGFGGGWVGRGVVIVADAGHGLPPLPLAIVMSIGDFRGPFDAWGGIAAAALSITVVFIPQYFRVIRAEVVRLKAEPFVEAAKVVGTGHRRIMGTHLLRNSTRTLPLIFTLNASESILTLAALG